jgi:hypothetical protein
MDLNPQFFLLESFARREGKDSVREVRYTGSKPIHIRVAGLPEWEAGVPGRLWDYKAPCWV